MCPSYILKDILDIYRMGCIVQLRIRKRMIYRSLEHKQKHQQYNRNYKKKLYRMIFSYL